MREQQYNASLNEQKMEQAMVETVISYKKLENCLWILNQIGHFIHCLLVLNFQKFQDQDQDWAQMSRPRLKQDCLNAG